MPTLQARSQLPPQRVRIQIRRWLIVTGERRKYVWIFIILVCSLSLVVRKVVVFPRTRGCGAPLVEQWREEAGEAGWATCEKRFVDCCWSAEDVHTRLCVEVSERSCEKGRETGRPRGVSTGEQEFLSGSLPAVVLASVVEIERSGRRQVALAAAEAEAKSKRHSASAEVTSTSQVHSSAFRERFWSGKASQTWHQITACYSSPLRCLQTRCRSQSSIRRLVSAEPELLVHSIWQLASVTVDPEFIVSLPVKLQEAQRSSTYVERRSLTTLSTASDSALRCRRGKARVSVQQKPVLLVISTRSCSASKHDLEMTAAWAPRRAEGPKVERGPPKIPSSASETGNELQADERGSLTARGSGGEGRRMKRGLSPAAKARPLGGGGGLTELHVPKMTDMVITTENRVKAIF